MKKLAIKSWFYSFIILLALVGCNKNGAGCFDKAGSTQTVTVDIANFSTIDVSTNVNVQLLNTGDNRVEITAGENLIANISIKVVDEVLKIENLNTCFWSKGYVSPLVSIRNSNLTKVVQHGYGKIYNTDTLKINNLYLQVEDASGAIDLMLDANSVRVVSNNIGSITLKGKVENLVAGHFWSDGIFYAKELMVENCTINQNGSNRMEVHVKNSLNGAITNIGNVYLFGQKPAIINIDITGDGQIIEMY